MSRTLPLVSEKQLSEANRRELEVFAESEAKALGVTDAVKHWFEPPALEFTKAQRSKTTLWVAGLTWSQDIFLAAALRGAGYNVQALTVPDNDALRLGKEFGNRGQCNPTYFTVGNLVKHLKNLESQGLTKERIIQENIFLTAGACGPCRFGTYVTEYRKALRDSGFDGFRVLLMEQKGEVKAATGGDKGLEFTPAFYKGVVLSFVVGDLLNLMGYRIRPYEIDAGSTNATIDECRKIIIDAFESKKSIVRALWKCRKLLEAVPVDRLRPKPMVSIIGEFWAMTTEGDGNYHLQQFLEQEGAEVLVQPITNWLLYLIWVAKNDTNRRSTLRGDDTARGGLAGRDAWKELLVVAGAKVGIHTIFQGLAKVIGLDGWHLPDMDHIAKLAHDHYDNDLRGGEGHMEVGKVLDNSLSKHAHMIVSVKPFGCMPSSGVSDGVQSLVTARHPDTIFCPIETTGDGQVNVHSRVQMMLFKAHERARNEFDETLKSVGLTVADARALAAKDKRAKDTLHSPKHVVTGTAANLVLELAAKKKSGIKNRVRALVGV
jgi:predicted nucleotide-binding protein (sugar kinase/HSP70/actin superfamily)